MKKKPQLKTVRPRYFLTQVDADKAARNLESATRLYDITWTQPVKRDGQGIRWAVCLMDSQGRRYLLGQNKTWLPELRF